MSQPMFRRAPLAVAILSALSLPAQSALVDEEATPAFVVHSTTQGYSISSYDIAALPNRRVAVLWTEHQSGSSFPDRVLLQRFDHQGQPVGEQLTLFEEGLLELIPSYTVSLTHARLAADASGNMVATWGIQTGPLNTVCDGDAALVRIRANDTITGLSLVQDDQVLTDGGHCYPSVAMDEDGDFAVLWRHETDDLDRYMLRTFLANGTPISGYVEVAEPSINLAGGAIAMQRDGTLLVGWQAEQSVGQEFILGTRYSLAGEAQDTVPFRLDNDSQEGFSVFQRDPSLTADQEGGFVAVWAQLTPLAADEGDPDNGLSVRGQRWRADGTPGDSLLAGGRQYNGSNSFSAPGVGADTQGNLATAWFYRTPGGQWDPAATLLDANSEVIGEAAQPFVEDPATDTRVSHPRVAMNNQLIAVAWSEREASNNDTELKVRIFPPLAEPTPGSSGGGGGGGPVGPLALLAVLLASTWRRLSRR
ncbi:hypothetical protein S7S_17185 [Isoalcanivorax pacificus W11-5]|uniref:Uncharacterized protein n=1 Tax=Isoalcanivorax pacificus W11-5 TaxID=391936 RepID=A0A0B4XN95_9GAMM|nr:hypothetical protein [Isoalcanivorax pacificus]AJD49849.1 hypothetical protein S7S_17185 [Isoalcanivorax pacificus W11-5]